MRFLFTARIPNRSGGTMRTIVADHPAATIDELAEELNDQDFIVVDEVWIDRATGESRPAARAVLACRAISKARQWTPQRSSGDEHPQDRS